LHETVAQETSADGETIVVLSSDGLR